MKPFREREVGKVFQCEQVDRNTSLDAEALLENTCSRSWVTVREKRLPSGGRGQMADGEDRGCYLMRLWRNLTWRAGDLWPTLGPALILFLRWYLMTWNSWWKWLWLSAVHIYHLCMWTIRARRREGVHTVEEEPANVVFNKTDFCSTAEQLGSSLASWPLRRRRIDLHSYHLLPTTALIEVVKLQLGWKSLTQNAQPPPKKKNQWVKSN